MSGEPKCNRWHEVAEVERLRAKVAEVEAERDLAAADRDVARAVMAEYKERAERVEAGRDALSSELRAAAEEWVTEMRDALIDLQSGHKHTVNDVLTVVRAKVAEVEAERDGWRKKARAFLDAHDDRVAERDLFESCADNWRSTTEELWAERDELQRALWAEQGDPRGALDGWNVDKPGFIRTGEPVLRCWQEQPGEWQAEIAWLVSETSEQVEYLTAPTAREAMRAAEEAATAAKGVGDAKVQG